MTLLDLPPPFDLAWFRFTLGFVVGSALGSFGTVLVYRLPRGLSLISPRSHCPDCKAQLKTADLVPILSWVANRGQCSHCGSQIGFRYLVIELAAGMILGAVAIVWGYQN